MVAALTAVLVPVAPVWAEPNVRVRAESRIEIGVDYRGPILQVRGALRDELAAPIPSAEVLVTLRAEDGETLERRRVETDALGRFVVERRAPESQVVLQAAYTGDALHRGVRVERRIDQARADVRLELQLPDGGRLDLDRESLPIRVLAESDSGGNALPMILRDEGGRKLAEGETDELGRLVWNLPTDRLGEPGSGQLRLESPGDATRGEAQTEARVVRFRRTRLTLTPPDDPAEAGRAARVQGRLSTEAGPRAAVPVGIFSDGDHVTTAITDPEGHFTTVLWPVEAGELEVVARAERDPVGAYTEAQQALVLKVQPPSSLPWSWLLLAIAPGLLWLVARANRAPHQGRGSDVPEAPVAGVATAPRVRRKATETVLSGRVVHARTRRPIAGARVRAVNEPGRAGSETDTAGRFELQDCGRRLELCFEAPGFAPLRTRVSCPHRGEWRDCEIRLESLRDRAVWSFRRLVLPRLPSALTFNLWTPREIGRNLRGEAGPELETLALRVEAAAYGAEVPSEEHLAEIDAGVARLAAEQAQAEPRRTRGSRPPGSHR